LQPAALAAERCRSCRSRPQAAPAQSWIGVEPPYGPMLIQQASPRLPGLPDESHFELRKRTLRQNDDAHDANMAQMIRAKR